MNGDGEENVSKRGKVIAQAMARLAHTQEQRSNRVEDFRERNCNVQTWFDVRKVATIGVYIYGMGWDSTLSAVGNYCMEVMYDAIVKKGGEEVVYTTTQEAVEALSTFGFKMGQYREGNRAGRRARQTMADEEVYLERKMQGDPDRMRAALTSKMGVYSSAAVDALVERALSPERLAEARKMAESRPSDVGRPRTAAEQEAIDKAQMQAMKAALRKPPTLANDMPK